MSAESSPNPRQPSGLPQQTPPSVPSVVADAGQTAASPLELSKLDEVINRPVTADAQQGLIETETFLRMAVAQGVSDIHLRVGKPPMLRKDGDILKTKLPPVSEVAMRTFLQHIAPALVIPKLKGKTDVDFSFELGDTARFRVNVFYEMTQPGAVLRVIPTRIPTLEDLSMPMVLKKFTELHKGLVLITGPTGSGKSTTLAALLNLINTTQAKHIVTLEDPIEFVLKGEKSVVTQRQLGVDTDSFPNGIKFALRQDPDIILIGEMRDRETIMAALHAAETGHLVFSTLHTIDSVQTINRIINAFEPHERDPVRRQLAGVLQGTVAQRLARKLDGKGRLAVSEILLVTPAIRDYIMRNEMDEIYQLLKTSDYEGTCSLNSSLYRAYRNQFISAEEALALSEEPAEMQQLIRGFFSGTR
jgi:twitching motility protein PilT